MNEGDLAVEKGNFVLAKEKYERAQQLNPNNIEMKFWYAITLANSGHFAEAKPIFKAIFIKNKKWQKLIPRLVKPKLLTISNEQINELLNM